MVRATIMRALVAVALAGASATAFSEPVYLSCVYENGPTFALGSPVTFTFDEGRNEILLGNGSPARNVAVTPTEISFLHEGPLHNGPAPISIDRISGRFRTAVSTRAGDMPASGSCTLTKNRKF
jgi:hypothetical protein